ncbi:hypothetical protein FRC06_010274, partial [Ceratobasidium sp. 370]
MGLGQACPASQSPSPIPGTPGADSEVAEHRHFVNGIDPTGTESSYHDYVESLDPAGLAAEFCRFVGPNAPTLSSQAISAQLKQYAAHHSAPVAPPERQVEVNQVSQNSFGIDRNNTARIGDSGPPKRSLPRRAPKHSKRQRTAADNGQERTGTETETETETENERTKTEPETELLSPLYHPIFPTRSPSPLLPEHVPSVKNPLGLLSLPSRQPGAASLGTTQASTQGSVTQLGNPTRPLAQMSAVTTESPNAQRLPTPSQPAHNCPPLGARPQPSQATARAPTRPHPADKQPSHPTSANSSRTSANNNPTSTQKKAHKFLQGQGIIRAISGSSIELMKFIQNSGELADALRELHRRQKVAVTTGVALKDVHPIKPRRVQLEEDLVPDNEKERSAQEASSAGDFPVSRKSKPTSRDLHGYEWQLISPAKLHLFAYALKKGVIQTRLTFFEWSDKSWHEIWVQQLPNLPPEVATTMIKQI